MNESSHKNYVRGDMPEETQWDKAILGESFANASINQNLTDDSSHPLSVDVTAVDSRQLEAVGDTNKSKSHTRAWPKKALLGVCGLVAVLSIIIFSTYIKREYSIARLDKAGSQEYRDYKKSLEELKLQWQTTENQMRESGASDADIRLAKKDFFEFIGSTILLKAKLESELSDIEKIALGRAFVELFQEIEGESPGIFTDKSCASTEQELSLPDFLQGGTIQFTEPMIYLEWEEEKRCTKTLASANYVLDSLNSWERTIFDKSSIKVIPIATGTTFSIEKKIKVSRGGLFGSEFEHYVLVDDNGVRSVPTNLIFDNDFMEERESGSDLYRDGQYVGHLITDVTTGVVWIEGTDIPVEVKEAHTYTLPKSFPTELSKRSEFLKRVMYAIGDNKLIDFSSQELIALDLGNNLYTYEGGKIIHSYGGTVDIKKDGSFVRVLFSGIPAGEKCYEFYFINDPEVYGFKETRVDGILEDYSGGTGLPNERFEAYKQKVCYQGNGSVAIEFSGTVNAIRSQAPFFRNLETTPERYR